MPVNLAKGRAKSTAWKRFFINPECFQLSEGNQCVPCENTSESGAYLWFLWGRVSPRCCRCGSGASRWPSSWWPRRSAWASAAAPRRWAAPWPSRGCPRRGLCPPWGRRPPRWWPPDPSPWRRRRWRRRRPRRWSWPWTAAARNPRSPELPKKESSRAVSAPVINVTWLQVPFCFHQRGGQSKSFRANVTHNSSKMKSFLRLCVWFFVLFFVCLSKQEKRIQKNTQTQHLSVAILSLYRAINKTSGIA